MHQNKIVTQAGTNIYFSHGRAKTWNGSGTPWTDPSTTPIGIGMADATGPRWIPQESVPNSVFAGQLPIARSYQSYPNVQEPPIPIHIRATTHDAAVAVLRMLKQELQSVSYRSPAVLVLQPDGATNAACSEIYSASFAINPLFTNDENGHELLRTTLTIERHPFFTNQSSTTSVFSSTSANNASSHALPTPTGDLYYEGQPINYSITPSNFAASGMSKVYLASCKTPFTTTSQAGNRGTGTYAIQVNDINPWVNDFRLRMRILQQYSAGSGVVQLYVEGVGYSERITVNGASYVDLGDFPVDVLRENDGSTQITVRMIVVSGSVTLANTTFVPYYDWCTIAPTVPESYAGSELIVRSFRGTSPTSRPRLPLTAPQAYFNVSGVALVPAPIIGTVPRIYPSSRLFIAFHRANGTFNSSDTVSLSATTVPLFLSFRGGA